jgi:glutathione S-transferase
MSNRARSEYPPNLTLYYSPKACSLASHIALEESGLPYEAVSIDIRAGQNVQPDYLKINPSGSVPALAAGDTVITESQAILTYIADLVPERELMPRPGTRLRWMPARLAVIGTGGISHWPCTPDTGTINVTWDREFLERWARNDRAALLDYTDEATYSEGGQGGYEIRTFIAAAGVAEGSCGQIWCYEPIPQFATGCTIGVMNLAEA